MLSDFAITQMQAIVFGLLTLPVSLWVIYTDLTEMKIRNEAVLATMAIFVVGGFFLMPFEEYLWRYLHFLVVLGVCFLMFATVGMGAGDAKYIAASAPMVVLADLAEVAVLYVVWSIILLVGMTIARRSTALRTAKPDWIWFADDRKGYVPFGLALAPTMSSYFLLAIVHS